MPPVTLSPAPSLTLDGANQPLETVVTSAGAYVLAIATTLPDLAVELHSVYVGHPKVETQVTHMALTPLERTSETHAATHAQLPVIVARKRCLYDHFLRLQELLADTLDLGRAQIDVLDQALLSVEK